ncbi:hypothetical protein HDR58_01705 [bacterium]|nr:hypothetical protein [bacterium]
MSSNWVVALDGLAAGGVIDFDAPAYLLDKEARYVGHPKFVDLPMTDISLLPEGTKIKEQPKADGFVDKDGKVQNPKWKKWAFLGLIAAGIGTIVLGRMGKLSKIQKPDLATVKKWATTAFDYIKKPFQWIASKFKKTP